MRYKKIMILAIFLVSLLAVSAVSAAENATDDVVSIEETTDEVVSVENENQIFLEDNNVGTFADLANEIAKAKSELNLNRNYRYASSDSNYQNGIIINKNIVINGNGFAVDGDYSARMFNVTGGDVVFKNIVFENGVTNFNGGAIYGKCTVENCTFTNNIALGYYTEEGRHYEGFGGALAGSSSTVARNCIFVKNIALWAAGAMDEGSAVNCKFINNTADYGGAIRVGHAVNCTFINNYAGMDGGAIAGSSSSAVNCTFIENTAGSFGGALYSCPAINCTFINNAAGHNGGAMDNLNGGYSVNCTFIGNSASDYGGAIYGADRWEYGDSLNCIFINNTAYNGGAIMNAPAVNCIFINNTASNYGGAMSGSSALNSTFIGNSAYSGGAYYDYPGGYVESSIFRNNHADRYGGGMCYSTADSCIFEDNTAGVDGDDTYKTTVLKPSLSVSDFESTYKSGEKLMIDFTTSKGVPITNANVRINVYKNNEFVGTYNCLSGDGWVVDLDPGSYVAVVSVPGSDVDSADAAVTVNKVKTKITSQKTTVAYNDGSKLVATLTNSVTGKPIANTNIVFKINDVKHTVKTDSKGQVKLSLSGLNPDEYAATISYAGNSKYASSTRSVKVIVNKADTIISATINDNELVATLTHGVTGKAISGAKIVANINDEDYSLKTDANGQATFTSASSISTATISYAGNAKYNPSSVTVNAKTNIIIDAVYNMEDNELIATLTNEATGKAVASTNVQFNINGATTTVKTNTKGQARLSAVGLPLGTNTATISYAGNSKYNPASTSISFNVKTKVIVTDVYAYSDKIVAKLTNGATGKTIANANMIVEINGVKYNAKSDNKGQLTFDTTGLDLPSSYDLTISYRGNDRYTASSATVAVDLNKANMMITTNYHADKQKMVATLKNSKTGKVVSNANMIIELNGVKTTYKSNDQGKITLPTADFAPGTYVGTVTYPGNARYNSISAVFKVDV